MKRSNLRFWMPMLLLLLWGCDPGTTTTNGAHVSDTVAQGGPAHDPKSARPWAADQNMLDAVLLFQNDAPLAEYFPPVSGAFLSARGISELELRGYGEGDNDLTAETRSEEGLKLTEKGWFLFNADGNPSELKVERYLGGELATSVAAKWRYSQAGDPLQVTVEEGIAGQTTKHTLSYNYAADGRPSSIVATRGISSNFGYDDGKLLTYEARRHAGASTYAVTVKGGAKAFPDSVCKEIYADLAAGKSAFVDAAAVGGKLKEVTFEEMNASGLVKQVHMVRADRIDYKVLPVYLGAHMPTERGFRWDEPTANSRILTTFKYADNADLVEVIQQFAPFNASPHNVITRYEYDNHGLVQRVVRTARRNSEPEVVELVQFWSVKTTAAATGSAVPGGTR